jgi:hypothetical protein
MINEYFIDLFENDLSLNSTDKYAILEEKSNKKNDELQKFKIDCKPIDFKMIKSDKIIVNNLFKGKGKGQKKHCDYLLITNSKVFFIELKTSLVVDNTDDIDSVIKQFKGPLCITDYIDSVLFHFYEKNKFFENVKKRYIVFCKNLPISKITTNLKELRDESNDKPNKYKIIEVDNDGVVAIEELG